MNNVFQKDCVVVDRVFSGYLREFIDAYSAEEECGQESYFTLCLEDLEEVAEVFPDYSENLNQLREEMSQVGAVKCIFLIWW